MSHEHDCYLRGTACGEHTYLIQTSADARCIARCVHAYINHNSNYSYGNYQFVYQRLKRLLCVHYLNDLFRYLGI